MKESELTVSVVIPVYNGAKTIAQTVKCLLNQSHAPVEIIVVNDGSTDQTMEVLNRFARRIRCITKPNGGPASARNRGISLSRGTLVAFTDSDCLPDQDWLRHLVRGFDSPWVAGVGGTVESVEKTIIGEYIDFTGFLNPQPDEQGKIPYLITANACFRRSALLEAGGFNERFRKPGGEEPELCWRIKNLGYEFRFVPPALVHHHHRQSLASFLRTLLNYGEGTYVLGQLISAYRIHKPGRALAQKVLSLRLLPRQLNALKRRLGIRKALSFSILNYLKEVSFSLGYLRGRYRGA